LQTVAKRRVAPIEEMVDPAEPPVTMVRPALSDGSAHDAEISIPAAHLPRTT
jgi:hypothetical protein